jgi:hypothetical protein
MKILAAMLCVLVPMTVFGADNAAYAGIEIPDGTKVICRLEQTLSSATTELGQEVQLSVTEDVKIGDTIVIAQGATIVGTVVQAQEKRRMGRTGKLDFSIDKVKAVDGKFIPLRYAVQKKEGGSHAVASGVLTAGVAVLFWPAAPFMLLMKGKEAQINKGMIFDTFTDSRHILASPSSVSTMSTMGVPPSGSNEGTATVTISSEQTGADITIDGDFVGNTPTTQVLLAGNHKITVTQSGKVWERDLKVNRGSSISLNAIFTPDQPMRHDDSGTTVYIH